MATTTVLAGATPQTSGAVALPATVITRAIAADATGALVQPHRRPRRRLRILLRSATGGHGHMELIFRQTMPFLQAPDQWLSYNPTDPEGPNFSKLNMIEQYRLADGSFELEMSWPADVDYVNHWAQSSSPLDSGVSGYRAIDVASTSSWWGGLERSTTSAVLLDGSVGHGNWWYAIGTDRTHRGGIPGPAQGGVVVTVAELRVCQSDRTPRPHAPTPTPVAPACHMSSCGKVGMCTDEVASCDTDDTQHEVRCCSDSAKSRWRNYGGSCNVWTESDGGWSCNHGATFGEAEAICASQGARLCTVAEAEGNCLRGTGCGHDHDLIWTSTTETPLTASPPPPPVAAVHDPSKCRHFGGDFDAD